MMAVLLPYLTMLGFGAYHGLNPGMGWLFALSLGLQQQKERALWGAVLPIALGHALSLLLITLLVLFGVRLVSIEVLRYLTALLLIGFGLYKLFYYYKHPRWVGMKVNHRDLVWWSFLMASAHGAGLMVMPALVNIAELCGAADAATRLSLGLSVSAGLGVGVLLHTVTMLGVMTLVALMVYRYWGLGFLRQRWINLDLLWAIALLGVGLLSLVQALTH